MIGRRVRRCSGLVARLLTVMMLLAAACGVDSEATTATEPFPALFDDASGSASGALDRRLAETAAETVEPTRLGDRFPWCFNLQSVWNAHASARTRFAAADEALRAARDDLDIAEAQAAHENAGLILTEAEQEAVVILRDAMDAALGISDSSPRSVAYARAWNALADSDESIEALAEAEAEARDMLEAASFDILAIEAEVLNAAELALISLLESPEVTRQPPDRQEFLAATLNFYTQPVEAAGRITSAAQLDAAMSAGEETWRELVSQRMGFIFEDELHRYPVRHVLWLRGWTMIRIEVLHYLEGLSGSSFVSELYEADELTDTLHNEILRIRDEAYYWRMFGTSTLRVCGALDSGFECVGGRYA